MAHGLPPARRLRLLGPGHASLRSFGPWRSRAWKPVNASPMTSLPVRTGAGTQRRCTPPLSRRPPNDGVAAEGAARDVAPPCGRSRSRLKASAHRHRGKNLASRAAVSHIWDISAPAQHSHALESDDHSPRNPAATAPAASFLPRGVVHRVAEPASCQATAPLISPAAGRFRRGRSEDPMLQPPRAAAVTDGAKV